MIYLIAFLLLILVLAYEPAAQLLGSLLALVFQLAITLALFGFLAGVFMMAFSG